MFGQGINILVNKITGLCIAALGEKLMIGGARYPSHIDHFPLTFIPFIRDPLSLNRLSIFVVGENFIPHPNVFHLFRARRCCHVSLARYTFIENGQHRAVYARILLHIVVGCEVLIGFDVPAVGVIGVFLDAFFPLRFECRRRHDHEFFAVKPFAGIHPEKRLAKPRRPVHADLAILSEGFPRALLVFSQFDTSRLWFDVHFVEFVSGER